MPRGDKDAYTDKQKRQAEHIEEGYEDRGVSKKEAEGRAWATVNAMSGGGKKSGSGRGKAENKEPARKGGRKGGSTTSSPCWSSPSRCTHGCWCWLSARQGQAETHCRRAAAVRRSIRVSGRRCHLTLRSLRER